MAFCKIEKPIPRFSTLALTGVLVLRAGEMCKERDTKCLTREVAGGQTGVVCSRRRGRRGLTVKRWLLMFGSDFPRAR